LETDLSLANPVLPAGKKTTTFLKVGLTGFEVADKTDRAPVNVAIVIDKSGSMSGEKIQRAREAAKHAIDLLDKDDIISITTYDSQVNVLVPSTKLADKQRVKAMVDRIGTGGNTALFGGVSKGAFELRKFLDEDRVNRVVLLSDGIANVGPSSPADLASLGEQLVKEGISVTTLGLGNDYNEDLMSRLASASDGNHVYIQEAAQLASVFKEEFGDILSVVAKNVEIRLDCADGVRPVRILGREADIEGQKVITTINQIYASQEKFLLLEVEVTPGEVGTKRELAKVTIDYRNALTGVEVSMKDAVAASFTESVEEVENGTNRIVAVQSVELIANDNNERAVLLRDQGEVAKAKELLNRNVDYLNTNSARWGNDKKLQNLADQNGNDLQQIDGVNWGIQRKAMRVRQLESKYQQKSSYSSYIKPNPAPQEQTARPQAATPAK